MGRLRDALELVVVFPCVHQRFLLRNLLLHIWDFVADSPALLDPQGTGVQLPFLRLNWLLQPALAPRINPQLALVRHISGYSDTLKSGTWKEGT